MASPPDDSDSTQKRLERLAWYLDSSIPLPGTDLRFGLDGLIGLIPSIGDTLGALVSSYILSEAARLGAPKSVLLKMAFNIAVDAVVGMIPVAGDLFDLAWKANQRNVRLLQEFRHQPRRTVVVSRLFVGVLAVILVAGVTAVGVFGFLVLRWLWVQLTSV